MVSLGNVGLLAGLALLFYTGYRAIICAWEARGRALR